MTWHHPFYPLLLHLLCSYLERRFLEPVRFPTDLLLCPEKKFRKERKKKLPILFWLVHKSNSLSSTISSQLLSHLSPYYLFLVPDLSLWRGKDQTLVSGTALLRGRSFFPEPSLRSTSVTTTPSTYFLHYMKFSVIPSEDYQRLFLTIVDYFSDTLSGLPLNPNL